MKEIWKDIEKLDNRYEISNYSKVRNKQTKHIIKENINSCGYKYVGLRLKGNKNKSLFFIHRLVAEAFIPNPNNYPIVNHIDGKKQNNRIENLEWCNRSYNMQHAIKNNLIHLEPVYQYDKNGNFIKKWDYVSKASKYYKTSHISECCKGKRKTTSGYIWKYISKKY